MQEVTLDLTATAIEVEQADINLEAETSEQPLRRRIIAVSEGTHNGINFSGEEIHRMVQAAIELKEQEGRDYFAAPLVLDHSGRFLDKVGSTYNLYYDGERKAAVADVEFWQFTPMLREVAERVKRDPENTYFSVRVRGNLRDDYSITDLKLIHIAVVLEPADSNARIIGELESDMEGFDMSKSETFDFGVVPKHPWKYGVDMKSSWTKPRLSDFTDKQFEELSKTERINIGGHYAWSRVWPPEKFEDLKFPHHNAKTHDLVFRALVNGIVRLHTSKLPIEEKRKIYNHFKDHYEKDCGREAPEFNMFIQMTTEEVIDLFLENSDFDINIEEKEESSMEAELQEKISNLEKENAELKAKISDLTEQIKEADEKLTLMAEILAIDNQVDREFLKSLNKEQLEKYKADLERRLTKTTEKSLSSNTKPDPFELAEKYYGPVEVIKDG